MISHTHIYICVYTYSFLVRSAQYIFTYIWVSLGGQKERPKTEAIKYLSKVIEPAPSTTDQSSAFQMLVGLAIDVLALYSDEQTCRHPFCAHVQLGAFVAYVIGTE